MSYSAPFRAFFALWIATACGVRAARALVSFNDGTDKIFVSGTFSFGHDSNLSASAHGQADYNYGVGAAVEYQRRAGLIGVTGNAGVTLVEYFNQHAYNSVNPSVSVEFDKTTGRTTGALTLSAVRSSQANTAANVFAVSWNYNAGLDLHYPVIGRYSLTGGLNYGLIDYMGTSGGTLFNLKTYSENLGVYYNLSDTRDFSATYRHRSELATAHTTSTDDALLFGVYGRIIWEINGSLVVGYQRRVGPADVRIGDGATATYGDLTATGTATWNMTKRTIFTGTVLRDFTTTAIAATTETTGATLDGTHAFNAKLSTNLGAGVGENRFLGPFGLLPGTNRERRDYYFTWNTGISYIWNDHLKVLLVYTYFHNWSNLAFATFVRNNWTVTLASRW